LLRAGALDAQAASSMMNNNVVVAHLKLFGLLCIYAIGSVVKYVIGQAKLAQ